MSDEKKQLLQQLEPLIEQGNRDLIAELLKDRRSSDIAEIVETFDSEESRLIFDSLDKETSAEILEKVDEATRSELFDVLSLQEITSLVSEMDPDDAADVLMELSEEGIAEVVDQLEPEESAKIKKLMQYSEDSAGGIMDPVVISVDENATVAEAINKIRSAELDEDFYSVYVVNKHRLFLGDVRIRLLLINSEDTKISKLIDPDTMYVTADADQEEVRNIFSKNDLIVVPVLDRHHKLIGRITADRIIEVAEEEAAEDLYAMAGTDANELETVSSVNAARVRMTWLLPCLIGTGITALVIMLFHKVFNLDNMGLVFTSAVPFVPMVGALSGNAGLQTSAIVISGLATGHLAAERLGQVFMREVKIALVVAICCGIIGAVVCSFLPSLMGNENAATVEFSKHLRIVMAFGISMFSAIMVATTLGLFLPFLFRKIGIDPAISSGPLVTTANDSISATIFMLLTFLLTK